jgi:glucosyl-dolichyl phosphate glucuronosyltransferase
MNLLPNTLITAAIPTYDRYALLEKCIESLVAQSIPAEQFKIIIIDNSPLNETANKFRRHYDGLRNIHYLIEKPLGVSNARNVAARLCNSEYIAYIDDDAIADGEWLESILYAFEKYGSSAGIVCGKVNPIWPSEPPQWLPMSLLSALSIVDHGDTMRIAQPGDGFAGTNFAVRVKPLLDLGGFVSFLGRVGNPAVLLSNEESHLIERMRGAGYETIWSPNSVVQHLVDAQRLNQAWLRRRYAWQAVSDFIADPDTAMKDIESKWRSVLYFMQNSQSDQRTPEVLFERTENPSLVEQQTYAVYCLTTLLLAGKELPTCDGHPTLGPDLRVRLPLERFLPREVLRSLVALFRGRVRSDKKVSSQ